MIPHVEPSFDENEVNAVSELVASGAWLTEYVKTRELEEQIARYLDTCFCHMYPNGTLAIYAACKALGIGRGHEVIVPDLTMIASATAVSMTGATCVFADVDPTTLCLSVDTIEKAITPKTRAIVTVDLNGRSPIYQGDFYWLAQRSGLAVIEDAAQAFGSKGKDGEFLGTCGDIGCFSFSPHKIITTGQGGCCVTEHSTLSKYLSEYRNFGRSKSGGFEHDSIGINLKFTDLQAVIGLEQFAKLNYRIGCKKFIFERYRDRLEDYVSFLPTDLRYVVPWYIDIYTSRRDALAEYLGIKEIGTQKMYPAISSTKAYFDYSRHALSLSLFNPVSRKASREGLFLPSSVTLTNELIDYVCDSVIGFMKG